MINGRTEIKYHEWFKSVDWIMILNQQINPPYVPIISDIEDLSNFDRVPMQKPYPKSEINKHAELFDNF